MFDYPSPGPLGFKFKLRRFSRGQPRSVRKRDIQNFLETQIDVLDQKQRTVFEEAARRFNIDFDTAEQYFKERRTKQVPEYIQFERAFAQQRRDEGELDYLPISDFQNSD